MNPTLFIVSAMMSAVIAAPQSIYGPAYVVSSAGGPTYTVSNSQRGFTIETGGSLPTAVRSGAVYSSQSSSSQSAAYAAQLAAEQAQRLAAEQASARFASEQAAAQRLAAEQASAARFASEQAASQRAAAEQAAAQRAAAQRASAQSAAAQRASAELVSQRFAAEQVAVPQPAYFSGHSAQVSGVQHNGARGALQNAYIIRQSQDLADDGSVFNYGFESDNGITVQAAGTVKSLGPAPEDQVQSVSGSYSYVGDDGQTYTVNYVADENGFRAEGAHLHPVPEEIARSIEYNFSNPPHPDTLLHKK